MPKATRVCTSRAPRSASDAGSIVWTILPGNPWNEVGIPWISEYSHYAQLATPLTGHDQGGPVFPFGQGHRRLRFGQDLLVATTAQAAVSFRMVARATAGLTGFG